MKDRAGLVAELRTIREQGESQVILAGHSYGGRQSSILASEDPTIADGLLLLSYPLHPPRKPDELRTAHLPAVRTRSLFIHGTRDPFGSIAELESALSLIPVETRLVPIEGAGHELKGAATPDLIASSFLSFFA